MKTVNTKRIMVLGILTAVTLLAPATNSGVMASEGGSGGGGSDRLDYFASIYASGAIYGVPGNEERLSKWERRSRNALKMREAEKRERYRVRPKKERLRIPPRSSWASSTDPRTGVTITSIGRGGGIREIVVTDRNGVVIDNYIAK